MKSLYKDDQWEIREEEAKLPNGKVARWSRVYRCDSVHILAFLDADTILMNWEYRPFYATWYWMLPSGKVDKEKDLMKAAQRELQEETGYRANTLTHWYSTRYSEYYVHSNHIFIAKDLKKAPLPADDDECIEVKEVKISDAVRLVKEDKIQHTPTAYALLRYAAEYGVETVSPIHR